MGLLTRPLAALARPRLTLRARLLVLAALAQAPLFAVLLSVSAGRRPVLLLAALGVVGLLALAWTGGNLFVVRPVTALGDAARRLAAGELGVRTGLPRGPAELNQLARAFDEMAASLEERTLALERSAAENARLLQEVRAASRLREEFLGAAAHELRTPATVLKAATQTLLRRPVHDEVERRMMTRILAASERTARLAWELIETYESSRGGLRLERCEVDLTALVEAAIRAQETLRGPRYLLCAAGPVTAPAAPEHLGAAVTALLEQAEREQVDGRRIRVTVSAHEAEAQIEIRDFGPRIPAERQPHVFEPLFEPWPPGSPHYVGRAGLGLYLARRIVEGHGGRIEFESGPETDNVFRITLARAG